MAVVIQLTKGYTALVDEEDADLADVKWELYTSKWGNVYARRVITVKGKRIRSFMHRMVLQRVLGVVLDRSQEVDHKNRNGLDNTRQNLRLASHAENARNRSVLRTNKLGVAGVYVSASGKFIASIQVSGKRMSLGSHTELSDAAKARREAEKMYFGEFAPSISIEGE